MRNDWPISGCDIGARKSHGTLINCHPNTVVLLQWLVTNITTHTIVYVRRHELLLCSATMVTLLKLSAPPRELSEKLNYCFYIIALSNLAPVGHKILHISLDFFFN